ncbi:MAG: hypothetical protein HQM12_01740 [SAR324 cluster bacterium]|nr:hypothetical protein [SAR324 cluster bacterium]
MSHKIMIRNFLAGVLLLLSLNTANAQFMGVSADAALSYSAVEGSVSGGTVGITHPVPLIPNIGFMRLSFAETIQLDDQYKFNTDVSMRGMEFFYHIPFPIVTFAIGIGGGLMDLTTNVIEGTRTIEILNHNTTIAEGFVRVGLSFAHVFEFHIGLHSIATGSIDLAEGSATDLSAYETKRDLTGTMTTVGIQLAF